MSSRIKPSQQSLSQESKRLRCLQEAHRLREEGKYLEAMKALQPLLKKAKPEAATLFAAGTVCEACGQTAKAIEYANRSLARVEHPDTLRLLARCCTNMWETEKALATCDRADAIDPGHLQTAYIRGRVLEQAGRFDEALAVVEPLMPQIQECGNGSLGSSISLLWGKILIQFKRYDEAVAALDAALTNEKFNEALRIDALHTKAKALDRSGQYRAAYAAARSANAIGEPPFQAEVYEQQVTTLIEHWSRERMANFPISACTSEVPVFVAGMPRSGTSLIDQIIDAHPRAAGVGELKSIDLFARQVAQAWRPDVDPRESFGNLDSRAWTRAAEAYVREIRRLSPGAERIVNKSLGNNRLVGLIARLFPKTRIIHAIRDPRDVAVSCFMGGFNKSLTTWTTRLEWVSAAWEQSERMMAHWKATLDVPILDVHYERLVSHPETEFPRIIEFLGLDWDDACREFHKSRRVVRTLSYDQVNRPLYTSSAGRNANYAEFMEGIRFPEYDPGC